ncbi:MAG: hypothetical protein H3Z50_04985 [archaeon]|nr:hypothetical protein [archaeon]MCP8306977.1 hypothetical protein [archaeon]
MEAPLKALKTLAEEVLAIEEIKQIYEAEYGWTKVGERTDLTSSFDEVVQEKYNRGKLAQELEISSGKLSQDLQLTQAVKKSHTYTCHIERTSTPTKERKTRSKCWARL